MYSRVSCDLRINSEVFPLNRVNRCDFCSVPSVWRKNTVSTCYSEEFLSTQVFLVLLCLQANAKMVATACSPPDLNLTKLSSLAVKATKIYFFSKLY
jgi:hypothetical protein